MNFCIEKLSCKKYMKILLKNIKKNYCSGLEKIKACDIEHLEFVENKLYALTGNSASGKTTLDRKSVV